MNTTACFWSTFCVSSYGALCDPVHFCMCTLLCVYTCVCVHLCAYTSVCTHLRVHTLLYVYNYLCESICLCRYTYLCVHIHVYTYVCIHSGHSACKYFILNVQFIRCINSDPVALRIYLRHICTRPCIRKDASLAVPAQLLWRDSEESVQCTESRDGSTSHR